MKQTMSALAAIGLALAFAPGAQAQTEIQWWHAMTGANNEVVETLAKEFNGTQNEYRVVPVFKGTYPETLQAGIAAFRAQQPPHILQVFDVGTGVMMQAEGAIMPAADILGRGGKEFDKSQYLPGIVAYYSTPEGEMLSFPFNSSSPILYYNKDLFQKAGLDVNAPPKTWPEVWEAARKITSSGAAPCGYTTTWPTWIHLENFAAWNNQPYATKQNGLGGTDVELLLNTPVYVGHFQALANLAKEGVFRYGGRTSEAKQLFLGGECGIMTESSGGLGDVVKSGINYGIGQLPYSPDAQGAPQNTIPGGASLWVFAGHEEEEYKGVAKFFAFLSDTDRQVRVHQQSGYLPITKAAYQKSKESGFYKDAPYLETPLLELTNKEPTENSRGLRLGNMVQLRDVWAEEIEQALAGQKSAKDALDAAVTRGNAMLRQFERTVAR